GKLEALISECRNVKSIGFSWPAIAALNDLTQVATAKTTRNVASAPTARTFVSRHVARTRLPHSNQLNTPRATANAPIVAPLKAVRPSEPVAQLKYAMRMRPRNFAEA